jgi:hypothetical protein
MPPGKGPLPRHASPHPTRQPLAVSAATAPRLTPQAMSFHSTAHAHTGHSGAGTPLRRRTVTLQRRHM